MLERKEEKEKKSQRWDYIYKLKPWANHQNTSINQGERNEKWEKYTATHIIVPLIRQHTYSPPPSFLTIGLPALNHSTYSFVVTLQQLILHLPFLPCRFPRQAHVVINPPGIIGILIYSMQFSPIPFLRHAHRLHTTARLDEGSSEFLTESWIAPASCFTGWRALFAARSRSICVSM